MQLRAKIGHELLSLNDNFSPRPVEIEDISNTVADDSRIYTSRRIVMTEIGFSCGHLFW
jgi:hypothetical protein